MNKKQNVVLQKKKMRKWMKTWEVFLMVVRVDFNHTQLPNARKLFKVSNPWKLLRNMLRRLMKVSKMKSNLLI